MSVDNPWKDLLVALESGTVKWLIGMSRLYTTIDLTINTFKDINPGEKIEARIRDLSGGATNILVYIGGNKERGAGFEAWYAPMSDTYYIRPFCGPFWGLSALPFEEPDGQNIQDYMLGLLSGFLIMTKYINDKEEANNDVD